MQSNLLLIGKEDRKRENLMGMLESLESVNSIRIADSCNQALNLINKGTPVTVLVDYRDPEKEADRWISKLIMNQWVEHVVLLKSISSPDSHFTHYSTSELMYDGLTSGVLCNLIRNIQRGT